jgi:thiol-disulfide isomerase/thioredoxin
MTLEARIAAVAALIGLAVAVGLFLRSRSGRIQRVSAQNRVIFADVAGNVVSGSASGFGERLTFLQFSGKYCNQCPPTARVLRQLTAKTPGAAHIEVDITDRLDLAKKYQILQTPTTLILDSTGRVKSRIGGAPKTSHLESELGTFEI